MKQNQKGLSKTSTAARTGTVITESDLPPAMWAAIDQKAAERGIDTERMVNEICKEWLAEDKEVEFFKKSRSRAEFESHTMEVKLTPFAWHMFLCYAREDDSTVEEAINAALNNWER